MVYRALSLSLHSLALLLLACVTSGTSGPVQAQGFELFGQVWQSVIAQNITQGWHHVYTCQNCRMTPSLSIVTSTSSVPDTALFSELDRSYDNIRIEDDIIRGHQRFTLLHATDPLSPVSPHNVTVVMTRYPSLHEGMWHFVQAVIETKNDDEDSVAQNLWLNLLGHASLDRHHMTIFPQDSSVVVDISSPDRNWFSDFVEQVGVEKLVLGTTITTTGLLLLGAQVALGAANVRGPCGKPLPQCPCTKRALKAVGLPAI